MKYTSGSSMAGTIFVLNESSSHQNNAVKMIRNHEVNIKGVIRREKRDGPSGASRIMVRGKTPWQKNVMRPQQDVRVSEGPGWWPSEKISKVSNPL